MKTQESGTAELTTYLPNQTAPFMIYGHEETLADLASDLQAEDARLNARKHKVSAPLAKAAVEAPVAVVAPVLEGWEARKATIKAKLFDMRWGTSEYNYLEDQRLIERRLRLRQAVGTGTIERCAKHEKQLASLR